MFQPHGVDLSQSSLACHSDGSIESEFTFIRYQYLLHPLTQMVSLNKYKFQQVNFYCL
jgi:hypothetical protein